MEVKLINYNVPVLAVDTENLAWSRVFGATRINRNHTWAFPAYPPFLERVLHDLPQVQPDVQFTAEAQQFIASRTTFEDAVAQAAAHVSPGGIQCYEHQLKGLAEFLHNWRWILQWEMGTGKTKVAIEALNVLKQRALVICPLIAVDNWVREVAMHSGGTLKTVAIAFTSKTKKYELLAQAQNCDVIIVPYDTARLYAAPNIPKQFEKILRQRGIVPSPKFWNTVLRVLGMPTVARFFNEWLAGRDEASIIAEAAVLPTHPFISDIDYTTIILDESHRIKNYHSKRTVAITELAKKAARRYLLTGTLSLGDPRDLYPQIRAISNHYEFTTSYTKFVQTHCVFSERNTHVVTSYKCLNVINERVGSLSSTCRLEDCIDMPGITDQNVTYTLSDEQIQVYDEIIKTEDATVAIHLGSVTVALPNPAIRLAKLLQICSGFIYWQDDRFAGVCDECPHLLLCTANSVHPGTYACVRKEELGNIPMPERETLRFSNNPKLDALDDLLVDILQEPTEKAIVWANFGAELDDIEDLLRSRNWPYVRVDGNTTQHIKKLEKEFMTNPACRVYLGQEATGIAINLTCARHSVYYSRSWSLEHWQQSRARNYRIGQKQKVVVYRLCGDKTLEYAQLYALDSKENISKLLTEKYTCLTCENFSKCQAHGITPWATGCCLSRAVTRFTTRARIIGNAD